MGICEQGLHQVAFDIGRAGEEAAAAAGLMLPVPIAADAFADGVVGLVLTEFQFIANIAVECGGEGSGNGGALRVGFGEFTEEIVSQAGIAGIEAAGGEAAMAHSTAMFAM